MNKELTKKIGDKAFTQFVASCVMNNWIILTPVGDCDRYDCVLDRGNGLERVQVKTGRFIKGSIVIPTSSSSYVIDSGRRVKSFRRSYKGQVDLFGAYCFETKRCYIVKATEVGNHGVSLRVSPTRLKKNIRWAKDYTI